MTKPVPLSVEGTITGDKAQNVSGIVSGANIKLSSLISNGRQ